MYDKMVTVYIPLLDVRCVIGLLEKAQSGYKRMFRIKLKSYADHIPADANGLLLLQFMGHELINYKPVVQALVLDTPSDDDAKSVRKICDILYPEE